MERTISGMMGKGSVNHNTRAFSAKNVDKQRSQNNVEFCNEDIKGVYHKLFDDALERYNAKQKRSDRKIDDYYDKIRRSKQEKLFHEVIFQIAYRAEDMERDVRKYEEDLEWKLPEASSFGSAKSYRENCALPLWRRLVARIKKLSIENIGLVETMERFRKKISSLENELSCLRDDLEMRNYKIERLEEQADDFNRVKKYMGEDRVQQVVDTVKVMEEQEREQKRLIRSRGWSR